MFQKVYHKIRSDEIHANAIRDYHIPTGEVHGSKIVENTLPGDRVLDDSLDLSTKAIDGSLVTTKIADGAVIDTKIADGAVRDRHIPTGEIHGSKIVENTMPGDRIIDASLDLTEKGIDGSLTASKIKYQILDISAVPDVDTEVAHNLGVTPTFVILKPLTSGVTGYLLENKTARSATSVTIRASVSGVDAEVILIA